MKKISCDVYRDILPLYADEVVSGDTREFVEAHLEGCPGCRMELEQLRRPVRLPSEDDRTLEAIRREWVRKNRTIWGLSLALLTLFLLMGLPMMDTAMQYHIQEMLGSLEDQWYLILPPAAVAFGVEWWSMGLKKARWLKFFPVVVPALVLVLAEVTWAMGGWDRFGSSILWYLSFPVLLGAALASLLKLTLSQPWWAKVTMAAVCVVLLLTAAFFLPKELYETLDVELEGEQVMVEDDDRYHIPADKLDELLCYAKISPCYSAPDWEPQRCVLVRLNERYVLAAPYDGTPYIYEYSGDLADFDGQNVCYRVYHYTALYIELKAAGSMEK